MERGHIRKPCLTKRQHRLARASGAGGAVKGGFGAIDWGDGASKVESGRVMLKRLASRGG